MFSQCYFLHQNWIICALITNLDNLAIRDNSCALKQHSHSAWFLEKVMEIGTADSRWCCGEPAVWDRHVRVHLLPCLTSSLTWRASVIRHQGVRHGSLKCSVMQLLILNEISMVPRIQEASHKRRAQHSDAGRVCDRGIAIFPRIGVPPLWWDSHQHRYSTIKKICHFHFVCPTPCWACGCNVDRVHVRTLPAHFLWQLVNRWLVKDSSTKR